MASQTLPHRLSFDEYLALEENAKEKSEYRGGEMFAMSGGTDVHADLAAELIFLLKQKGKKGCRVYTSDLKIYVPAANESMYPDVSVVCGPREYYQARHDVVLNPVVLIEVLSPSTADYDRGMKAQFYRQISSLKVLLLADSQKRYLQTQTRQSDGSWKLEEFTASEQQVQLDRWTLSLDEIYSDILEGPAAQSDRNEEIPHV